jgi:hypothetical protein
LAVSAAGAFTLGDSTVTRPRVDYDRELVYLELWRGDYFVGVEGVVSLEEFVDRQLKDAMLASWQAEARRVRERRELSTDATGLIPDIELPKLPIFGEGSRIDISGQDRITLGGRQTNVEVQGVPRAPGQRALPELKMEQQLAVRVNGTIGERTKVNIDHDSERQEGKNKIKLSYEGGEDDVVQAVELGDTRLAIPGTQYTGDLPALKGLFGVSARGKLAGADIYAVASREESQGQSQSFTGRRRVTVDTIYARAYLRNRFFTYPAAGDVRSIRVYIDDKNPTNNEATIRGIATVLPDRPDSVPAGWSYDRAGGDFDLKTVGNDFVIHPGNVIEFARGVEEQGVVGVVVFGDDTLGGRYHNDSLVMVMLKPEVLDVRSATWDLSLRNVYQLPQQEVQLSSASILRNIPGEVQDIDYEDTDPARRKFLELLGLDPDNDGRLQYPQFDQKTGLIRFPAARPFDSPELSVRDSVLYRKYPLEPDEGMFYYLVVAYSSATESYYLGQVDIERESERVHVDGVLQARDIDYEINYSTGLLSFRRELPANAEIRVTYEYRPLFSIAQKSLVGTRTEWKFGQNSKVGASVFHRSEGTPDEKPALGSEPFQRTIAETDASWSVRSDGVTALLDRLPLLRVQAPSSFDARVEGAVSLPDPNTRGVAWLDDFESTTITRDMTVNARLWSHASVPVEKDTGEFARRPLLWWSPWADTQRIRKDSVFGPAIGEEGRETQDFLRVIFAPDPGRPGSWAGIMHCPSQMGMNLKDLDNLQVILRTRRGRGTVHVSAGMSIDEDAPRRARDESIVGYNGRLDTEDKNGNGILDAEEEDTGLDRVFGVDDSLVAGDDANDDYDHRTNQLGTERNGQLDSEDLDRNGFSRYNHYFEADIPLGDPAAYDPLHGDWRLYRVTLDSSSFRTVGSPKWENIRVVRIWLDGFDATDTIDFFSLAFVGSKWRAPGIADIAEQGPPRSDTESVRIPEFGPAPSDSGEAVWVTQVSKKTDPGYVSPFEPRRNAQGLIEQEAALLFGYRNLRTGRRAIVSRVSSQRDDFRDYGQLRIFVHDDGNGLGFVLRIGADSLNYYAHAAPVTGGTPVPGRAGWFEFIIDLDSFPALKPGRDSAGRGGMYWSSGRFRIRGNPSLADIRYLALGIENEGPAAATGGIWFNDLRLSAPRKEPGYGLQASVSAALSDFASVGATASYSDPNFRRFSEGRGVKTGGFGTNYGVNARANLDRLTPTGWGLLVPVSYSISERRDLPKYSAMSPDLRLDRESGAAEEGHAREENVALENLRKQRSGNRLLNYTLEAMGLSWRARRGVSRAALADDSAFGSSFQWGYAVSPNVNVRLGEDNDLALLPQGIRIGLAEGRNRSVRISRRSLGDTALADTTRTVGHGLNTDVSIDYAPIEDLSFEYSVGSDRDLLINEDTLARLLPVGSESGRDENLSASYSVDLWDFLTPSVDFDGEYNDDRPREGAVRYAPYRNLGNSGELELGLSVDVPELADRLRPAPAKRSPDSASGRAFSLRGGVATLAEVLDPLEFGFSTGRSADIIAASIDSGGPAPLPFRLGFTNSLDDSIERGSENFENTQSWRASSGLRVKDFRVGAGYDWSQSINTNILSVTRDRATNWPDLDYGISRLHGLFKDYATDSRLNGRYRRRTGLAGGIDEESGDWQVYGLSETQTHELNPLVSWQTTWKRKITTTVSANYSLTEGVTYLGNTRDEGRSETRSDSRGGRVQLSYAFSAPKGFRLPVLKGVRFTSDLRLTWSLDVSQSARLRKNPDDLGFVPLQNDRSWSTRVTGAYMFSRAIEAGANVGYGYSKAQTGTETNTTDLDIWVLFRF